MVAAFQSEAGTGGLKVVTGEVFEIAFFICCTVDASARFVYTGNRGEVCGFIPEFCGKCSERGRQPECRRRKTPGQFTK
jgi:hypothetical protein